MSEYARPAPSLREPSVTPPVRVILLMGVSGAGKTTLGQALAAELGWAFEDADAYHADAARSVEDSPIRDKIEPMVKQRPGRTGVPAAPGTYSVRLTVGLQSFEEALEITADPRLDSGPRELAEQTDLCLRCRDKLSELNVAVDRLRRIQRQALDVAKRACRSEIVEAATAEEIEHQARLLLGALEEVEGELTQVDLDGSSDTLRVPVRLNGMLSGLISAATMGDGAPTESMTDLLAEIEGRLDGQLNRLQEIVDGDVAAFNSFVDESKLPPVSG